MSLYMCIYIYIIYIIYLNIYIYSIFYIYIPHFSRALDSKHPSPQKVKIRDKFAAFQNQCFSRYFSVYFHCSNIVCHGSCFFSPSAPWTSCGMRRRPVELSNNFDAAIHLIVACLFVGQRRKYAELRKAMDECIYIYVYVCVYIYIYISKYVPMLRCSQAAVVCMNVHRWQRCAWYYAIWWIST